MPIIIIIVEVRDAEHIETYLIIKSGYSIFDYLMNIVQYISGFSEFIL